MGEWSKGITLVLYLTVLAMTPSLKSLFKMSGFLSFLATLFYHCSNTCFPFYLLFSSIPSISRLLSNLLCFIPTSPLWLIFNPLILILHFVLFLSPVLLSVLLLFCFLHLSLRFLPTYSHFHRYFVFCLLSHLFLEYFFLCLVLTLALSRSASMTLSSFTVFRSPLFFPGSCQPS